MLWRSGEGSAGAMRAVVARESAARKAAASAALAKQNEEMQKRLDNVKSKTDDGDGEF